MPTQPGRGARQPLRRAERGPCERGGGPRLTRRARADVGLAKLLSSAQTMASAVGTFDWAAPEILAGAPVRRAWDAGVHAHACGVIGGRRAPASYATVLKCLEASAERVSDARCPAGEPCNEKADIYRWACAPLMFRD
jgi:serine/threonine protein kinase